jgi:coenzyme PQQ biosynthesis protein PqqD
MGLSPASRPKLASKARLRWDRREEKFLLLYPERGLLLNSTAADIVQLCTGKETVEGIIRQLSEKYSGQSPEEVEREVMSFLSDIAGRGLLEMEKPLNADDCN